MSDPALSASSMSPAFEKWILSSWSIVAFLARASLVWALFNPQSVQLMVFRSLLQSWSTKEHNPKIQNSTTETEGIEISGNGMKSTFMVRNDGRKLWKWFLQVIWSTNENPWCLRIMILDLYPLSSWLPDDYQILLRIFVCVQLNIGKDFSLCTCLHGGGTVPTFQQRGRCGLQHVSSQSPNPDNG